MSGEPGIGHGTGVTPTAFQYRIVAGLSTDVGCRRQTNEDCARLIQPVDPELLARRGVLVIVADGMGGALGGEVASRMAAEVIGRVYYEYDADPQRALEHAFHEANREIYRLSDSRLDLHEMGSTCTALAIRGGSAHMAHVGDSRLYLIRSDTIYRMSEDHSAVMEMVKQGLLSPESARKHADRNMILRALGTRPEVEVSVWQRPLGIRPRDRFLLCSDGLHDLVTDEQMRECAVSHSPAEACETLIALAKNNGGHDNITVGVVSIEEVTDDQSAGRQAGD